MAGGSIGLYGLVDSGLPFNGYATGDRRPVKERPPWDYCGPVKGYLALESM